MRGCVASHCSSLTRNLARGTSLQPRCLSAMRVPAVDQKFGPHTIGRDEQFAHSALSFAFVNLKPIVKGHVLISPRRVVPRFVDLSDEEIADLWQLARRVGRTLEERLEASSLTLAIQDGPQAGQSVPHVHIHCLPRRTGDFKRNDDVYDALDRENQAQNLQGEKLDMDAERVARTPEEMQEEAALFRRWMQQSEAAAIAEAHEV